MIRQERTPYEWLGMFFMVWMGCFLFFNLVAAGFVLLFYGQKGYEMLSSSEGLDTANLNLVRYLQIILSIGIFGAPPLVFMLIRQPRNWSFFRLNGIPSPILMLLAVVIVVFSAPLILWALDLNQKMTLPGAFQTFENYLRDLEEKNEHLLQSMLTMKSRYDFFLNFLMIALIPAFVEELLFRGTLQQLMQEVLGNAHAAIIITGMFFSFIHFEFYGFFPRMLLGILFGYLFFWSGNLWLPIFAHFLHNGVQVVLLYLFQTGKSSFDVEEMGAFPPYITMIATVLLFVVVYIFDIVARKKEAPEGNGEKLG